MASNNERVTQLLQLYATEIQLGDVFLVTDISQHESKQLQIGQLLLYIENSGSFNAINAITAATASYVAAYNVSGIVASASSAANAISASWANFAGSGSWAATASWANFASTMIATNAQTASYLRYAGFVNGTSSYALKSNVSNISSQSLTLFFNGQPNGTASWAQSASVAISSSYALSSSFAPSSSVSISSSYAVSSSNAITASYCNSNLYTGPTFISPVTVYNSTAATTGVGGWATFNCTTHLPAGVYPKVILLDYWLTSDTTVTQGYIYVRPNSSTAYSYTLASYIAGSTDYTTAGGQASCPLDPLGSLTFQYNVTQATSNGTTIRFIGYY